MSEAAVAAPGGTGTGRAAPLGPTLFFPFVALTVLLTFGAGALIAGIERKSVMTAWPDRRCELPVAMASFLFKPAGDTRSSAQFALDNWQFCMGQAVNTFTEAAMAPFSTLFSKHGAVADDVRQSFGILRSILATVYKMFEGFLEQFFAKYVGFTYALAEVIQRARMAFQRVHATVLSLVFSGLAVIRGILNMRDFIIRIVLIILGVMVALIIILFFILIPFIPMILTTIAVIGAVVGGGATAGMAGAFCFSGDTVVMCAGGRQVAIRDLRVGDVLCDDGVVEATMEFDGSGTYMYIYDGVYVSGDHLVREAGGAGGAWRAVRDSTLAAWSGRTFDRIYCLKTSTRRIHVRGAAIRSHVFADWEEIPAGDKVGEKAWAAAVRDALQIVDNRWQGTEQIFPQSWRCYRKGGGDGDSGGGRAGTAAGTGATTVPLSALKIGDVVYDGKEWTTVRGVVRGHARSQGWTIVQRRDEWVKSFYATEGDEDHVGVFTDSEVITLLRPGGPGGPAAAAAAAAEVYRDYSEIGTKSLELLRPLVLGRLAAAAAAASPVCAKKK